jgi:hypothetical protein
MRVGIIDERKREESNINNRKLRKSKFKPVKKMIGKSCKEIIRNMKFWNTLLFF